MCQGEIFFSFFCRKRNFKGQRSADVHSCLLNLWKPTEMDINQWGERNEVNRGRDTIWRKKTFRVQQEKEKTHYCEGMNSQSQPKSVWLWNASKRKSRWRLWLKVFGPDLIIPPWYIPFVVWILIKLIIHVIESNHIKASHHQLPSALLTTWIFPPLVHHSSQRRGQWFTLIPC